MGKLFISYRRDGGPALAAAALANRLSQHFGRDRVFIDTGLAAGDHYPDRLRAELADCDVVIAVIHAGWVADFGVARRLDWVRHELATALAGGKTVLPVLLENAARPRFEELPEDIAAITRVQDTPLRSEHYEADIGALVAAVERTSVRPGVALTVVEEPWPPRRLARQAAVCGILFAAVMLFRAAGMGYPAWKTLVSAAFLMVVAIALLTVAGLVMMVLGPALHRRTRRDQERSFRASLGSLWPIYAGYLLVLVVIWTAPVLFHLPGLSPEIRILLTGLVVIVLARLVQHQVDGVVRLDRDWPPPVTPDTLTFRRAATRVHERLVADGPTPRDLTWLRQAESVREALVRVRVTLEQRTRRTRWQWLTGGGHGDILPAAIVGTFVATIALSTVGLGIGLATGDLIVAAILVVAVIWVLALALATVALSVCFRADRRRELWLVEELREWDRTLGPALATTLGRSPSVPDGEPGATSSQV